MTREVPDLVRQYVERNARTSPDVRQVRFKQRGQMQLRPGRWRAFDACQEMRIDRGEFAWQARFKLGPIIWLDVFDWFRGMDGRLDGRLWGLIPIVKAGGPAVARGEAMRYLAELPWAPQAMVANPALLWQEVEDATVAVATRVHDSVAEVQLHFDSGGDIVRVSATRPRLVGKNTVDTPFSGTFSDYRDFGDVRSPT